MPLNHLLLHLLIPGVTRAHDPGTGREAIFDRLNDETVLVFGLDNAETRKRLGLDLEGQKCCNHMFFYKSKPLTIFLFTELKTGDANGADQQLLSAIRAICSANHHTNVMIQNKCVRALIVTSLASPARTRARDEMRKRMKKAGVEVYFGTSRGRGCSCQVRKLIPELSN